MESELRKLIDAYRYTAIEEAALRQTDKEFPSLDLAPYVNRAESRRVALEITLVNYFKNQVKS